MRGFIRICRFIVVAFLAGFSCSSFYDNDLGYPRRDTGNLGRKPQKPTDVLHDTSVFVTCVEFPSDYCWQRDTAGYDAPFSVSVLKNGEKVISVAGGASSMISADADMHRFVNGHLYSDYSTPSETIVSKDGEELFRYPGRERMCGFLVRDGDIYTLGQNRSGKGLSFRKNGEPIFSSAAGRVIGEMSNSCCESGALYEVEGDIVFSYKIIAESVDKENPACYLVRNGNSNQIPLDNRVVGIYDARLIGDKFYVAADMGTRDMSLVLIEDDDIKSYSLAGFGFQLSSCRILWSGNNVSLKTDFSYDKWRSSSSVMWHWDGRKIMLNEYERAWDFYLDESSYAYVFTRGENIVAMSVHKKDDGKCLAFTPGGRYTMISSSCAMLSGGVFYAGLSPCDSSLFPLVVREDKATTLKINGYITSLNVSIDGRF